MTTVQEVEQELRKQDQAAAKAELRERAERVIAEQEAEARRDAELAELKEHITNETAALERAYAKVEEMLRAYIAAREELAEMRMHYETTWRIANFAGVAPLRVVTFAARCARIEGINERRLRDRAKQISEASW